MLHPFTRSAISNAKQYIIGGLFVFLVPVLVHGIEEKDWVNTWPTEELQGTEKFVAVEPEQITDYAVSITYALDRGRFGDQLANYIKALWVSWKYELPLVYRPFDYSDELMLSTLHSHNFNEESLKSFSKKVEFIHSVEKTQKVFDQLEKLKNSQQHPMDRLLCIISFLTPFVEEQEDEKWDDENFRTILQEFIRPKQAIEPLKFPDHHVTVALHVRTGEGYDWQLNIDNMPTKFPADTFYLNSLKQIANHFEGQPLYVRIFTDDPQPTIIRDRYLSKLKDWGIENPIMIDCRISGNSHDSNVLEDFFMMTQFDCLIRPDSNFSRCVSGICGPVVEAKPSKWDEYRKDENGKPLKDKNGKLIVDSQIIYRTAKGKNIIQRRIAKIESDMLFN